MDQIKLDIGSGRNKPSGYTSIDLVQIIDGNKDKTVDIVLDIEKEVLPYNDSSVTEVRAMNVLEHLTNLKFALNEMWRVLSSDGSLVGCVPIAGTSSDFKDPTHVRHFTKDTFNYFTGTNLAFNEKPAHPKYADYGFKPWYKIEVIEKHEGDDLIYFKLKPRKI